MSDWFVVEDLGHDIYRISEPYHWEKTNMYYVIGRYRNVLIDTGTGLESIKPILLGIDDKPIDVILTHVHWDHIGCLTSFDSIYVHEKDSDWLKRGLPIPSAYIFSQLIKDVDETKLTKALPLDYETVIVEKFNTIEDGFTLDLGHRSLKVIHTPGHSPGHICVYDSKSKHLFTGDLIYKGCIYCNYPSTSPVELDKSYRKLREWTIDMFLPGHYEPIHSGYLDKFIHIMNQHKKTGPLKHGLGKIEVQDISIWL